MYWGTNAGVMKVPLAGGTPVMVAPEAEGVRGLALDATQVYWTVLGDSSIATGRVMKARIHGLGAPVALASDQARANYLAVDAHAVYGRPSAAR